MSEVAFAKSFLTSLDARPAKLSADHVEDPRSFPPRPPYILPRMPRPMSAPERAPAPGAEPCVTLALRSLRNPPLEMEIPAVPVSTALFDIKARVAARAGVSADKVRLLYAKRPLQDSKLVRELLPAGGPTRTLELAVMVLGGGAVEQQQQQQQQREEENTEELETDAFWGDLVGFLAQRLRSQERADELAGVFRAGWQASRGSA